MPSFFSNLLPFRVSLEQELRLHLNKYTRIFFHLINYLKMESNSKKVKGRDKKRQWSLGSLPFWYRSQNPQRVLTLDPVLECQVTLRKLCKMTFEAFCGDAGRSDFKSQRNFNRNLKSCTTDAQSYGHLLVSYYTQLRLPFCYDK